ncbi:hypothetical protein [Lewinella sp. IMCC34183]|uniref:hypothetical protein n=1 Tax=Lewinella sp. IMCC34183 TaxID=2248762 RepID=UPI001300813C|nr:hypothetical protein [Lewinella sp. IMCC34183]
MFLLLVFALLVLAVCCCPNKLGQCIDILFASTKEQIARWYGVRRPTLSKWIDLFTPAEKFPDWARRKKLRGREVLMIFRHLGSPLAGKSLKRGEIAERTFSNTGVLRNEVERKAETLGFDIDTYNQVTVYPPAISQRIVDMMLVGMV